MKELANLLSPRRRRRLAPALLFLVGCLAVSCRTEPGQNTANVAAPASPTATSPDASRRAQTDLASPFVLGERRFASRQEFIEAIRPRCATEEPSEPRREAIRTQLKEFTDRVSPQERTLTAVEILVHFHVVTNSVGTEGRLTAEDVRRQIEVLNAAYAGAAPGGAGTRTPFRFRLVEPIEFIADDRLYNVAYNQSPTAEERELKRHNIGGKGELNFYTARLADDTLGWARWPWDFDQGVDGVVVRFSTLPGGSSAPYDQGDTGTHEVGHWLGLFHTFQGGCSTTNDEVADTPAERSPAAGCPTARDTCPSEPGTDPVENFMDYSDDFCMFKFTDGQSTRMSDIFARYRR
ncbi:MAG: zinc metalloprotease [Acidobacteria bacterium]|nr:zinc metalloprotease [Acidobacteriota bacterium]